MPAANDLRKGMAIKYNGNPAIVLEVHHRTPGNLRAFVQAIIRYINTGKSADVRFGSTDKVELVDIERKQLEFSYKDRDGYHFMDPETYDTITLTENFIGQASDYLVENLSVQVLYAEGKAVEVELPASVSLKVVESAEGLRGDTASNVTKPAKLETGKTINVPLFIKEGEAIKIDTRTGGYILPNLRTIWRRSAHQKKRIAARATRSAAAKLSVALRAQHPEALSQNPSRSLFRQSG
jgi:elongation factor P